MPLARIYLWKNGASNYAADEDFHTIFTIFYRRQQQRKKSVGISHDEGKQGVTNVSVNQSSNVHIHSSLVAGDESQRTGSRL
jgi:hypothetical protein